MVSVVGNIAFHTVLFKVFFGKDYIGDSRSAHVGIPVTDKNNPVFLLVTRAKLLNTLAFAIAAARAGVILVREFHHHPPALHPAVIGQNLKP